MKCNSSFLFSGFGHLFILVSFHTKKSGINISTIIHELTKENWTMHKTVVFFLLFYGVNTSQPRVIPQYTCLQSWTGPHLCCQHLFLCIVSQTICSFLTLFFPLFCVVLLSKMKVYSHFN